MWQIAALKNDRSDNWHSPKINVSRSSDFPPHPPAGFLELKAGWYRFHIAGYLLDSYIEASPPCHSTQLVYIGAHGPN